MTTRKVKSPAKQGTLTKKEINDAVKAVVSETKASKPTIKSLQAELDTVTQQLTQANALVEMLEEGLANTREIANDNADIAKQAATEKAQYKSKYLYEINRSWWDITKERFTESLYQITAYFRA